MINIAIKLATSITYTADGSQTNFSVPFDYLRPSFVHVSVNDAEVSEGFTISNRMVMFDSAPAKDSIVHIYRSTPTTRLVSWADASILKAKDMTVSEVQQLHILEEASDWSKTNSIVLDEESGAWQGRKCRVSNVADPKDAQDVVTKKYMETVQGGFVTENTKLKDEATRQAELAKGEMLKAKQYAEAANDSKDLAKRWAEATDSPDYTISKSAKTWAEEAKDARDEAKDTAVNLGNPVVNITEDKGTVTVNKSDGSSSNFTTFPKFVEIPANADLNDYQQEGFYICKTNKESISLKNCPVKSAFLMEVYKTSYMYEGTQDSWCHQRIIVFNTSLVYIRAYGSWDGGEWYLWQSTPAIGTILPFAGSNAIPNGYLVCDGAAISRTTYALLFDVIGTTYGDGDGSTTFNLPNLKGRYIEGQNEAQTGTVWEAGLPNITGGLCSQMFSNKNDITEGLKDNLDHWSGALNTHVWSSDTSYVSMSSGGNHYGGQARFDASKSNPIYGKATTVQPPAVTMRYIIKY
nr:MAG TPA: tail fiber protein [Bacteriophage sp.]